jgi:p-cumate 2,3-dioxygenase beta subunit
MTDAAPTERQTVMIDLAQGRFRVHRGAYRRPEAFEAELLDDWRLPKRVRLYADRLYDIALLDSPDPLAADPEQSVFVLSKPKFRIVSRAKRLIKKAAHAEYPHSQTRHLTSNIRLGAIEGEERRRGRANFVVYRSKCDKKVQYMGEAHYRLAVVDGVSRIRRKRLVPTFLF